MKPISRVLVLAAIAASLCASAAPAATPIALQVDLGDLPLKVIHVSESIPCSPGTLELTYPKWLPGEHGPTGPLTDVAGLKIVAGGKALPWRRDDVDLYTVRVEVPAGARGVDVTFDFILSSGTEGFSSAASFTENLALVSWNQVLVYPNKAQSDDLVFHATLTVPANWKIATALPRRGGVGPRFDFEPVSLTTLVDSPVLAGRYLRTVELTPGQSPPMYLDIACDGPDGLAIDDAQVDAYRRLVREAKTLFGATHFRDYHFLCSLSEHIAHFGLEHHESSDDRMYERGFVDEDLRALHSNLLSHELVHSWNGKYRRPAGLATGNFHDPMKGEMLWVYEGLTQYLGFVLAARSGVRSTQQTLDYLALQAAYLDARPGRTWRPLLDTAVEAQRLYEAPELGDAWRRGTDFYNEGLLTWLEADLTIRRLTHDARSLDDFCRVFHGSPSGPPQVVPYTFDDVCDALNKVAPYDWRGFWNQRLTSLSPRAPMGGITDGGWKVAFADSEQKLLAALERASKEYVEEWFSIGIRVLKEDGTIQDVLPGSAAARAGIGPGVKLVAVNGRKWSKQVLRDAIRATRKATTPLELITLDGEFYSTHRLDWRGGERFPWLVRDTAAPDRLGEILRPHAK
jgi:predicted metalloprotease with PDZ domain